MKVLSILVIACCLLLAVYLTSFGQERLLPVTVDGMCGFINISGEVVITPQFVEYHSFSEGYSLVKKGRWLENGSAVDIQSGYVNSKGDFKERRFRNVY
jgi:hypothetical protein